MRYLVGTQSYEIVYDGEKSESLIGYADSDWAADTLKRRSTTGYFAMLASGIVTWLSCLQNSAFIH